MSYDTDLTDAQWALVEPYMPRPCVDGRGLILEPQPADVQDLDGAPVVLRLSRLVRKAFADVASPDRVVRFER